LVKYKKGLNLGYFFLSFNPYRGCLWVLIPPPGFTWGYSHSTPIGVEYVIALYFTQSAKCYKAD